MGVMEKNCLFILNQKDTVAQEYRRANGMERFKGYMRYALLFNTRLIAAKQCLVKGQERKGKSIRKQILVFTSFFLYQQC